MSVFSSLMGYPQFIMWKGVKEGEKVKKIPIDYRTGLATNPHNPNVWITGEQAVELAATTEHDVGFVITKNDPFWLLDIDNCVVDGQWSELATHLMSYLQGCGIEISQSGKGLHIFGTGDVPEHACKNTQLGIELYHKSRFVALGTSQVGDAAFDASAVLPAIVDHYFPPAAYKSGTEWTTEHSSDSLPILDDRELISKACSTKSSASIFGGKASFKDLYRGNEDVLADTYPPQNNEDGFDRSSADAALCQHLAFWTGKDCERMERLFSESGLVRDKWTSREDYRRNTILNAVSMCVKTYGAERVERIAKAEHVTSDVSTVQGEIKLGLKIVDFQDIPEFFCGHYYLTSQGKIFCPDGIIRSQTDYNSMYSNFEFLKIDGSKPYSDAWKTYVVNPEVSRMEAFDTGYFPEHEFGQMCKDGGRTLVNEYINLDGVRVEGDAGPFVTHLKNILPRGDDAEILLSWVAALIQYPGKKFLWSPFLQGTEGNGKSLIVRVIEYCIGKEHVHDIDPEDFCNSGGKFNAYVKNKRLGVLQEIKSGDRKQADSALKRVIDHGRIGMQKKGVDQTTVRTCINIFITSNWKDALPITDSSRRYTPLFCAQQDVEDLKRLSMHRQGTYFRDLMQWFNECDGWAIVANYIAMYDIPEQYNPVLVDKAPITTALEEAVEESRTSIHQAVCDALASEEPGTLGFWASTIVIKNLLVEAGYKSVTSKTVSSHLKLEGYAPHKALNRGRATKIIMAEGGRPTLFVKTGKIPYNISEPKEAMSTYIKAQGYDTAQQVGVK